LDVIGWEYDDHGGPFTVDIESWNGEDPPKTLSIDDIMVFTFDKEAGNIEGIPLLRSAYKHWYFKENLYKIDAIQKERHGIGIPMIRLPPGFKPQDKVIATNMGKNLRTNEMAHIVLPPGWEVTFVKVEGNPVNVMESIEHHDTKIYDNILAGFLKQGGVASQEQEINLFLRASRVTADIIADVVNKYGIPQLIDYNWPNVEKYPTLMVRRIGDTQDQRTLSFALRNLVGAGIIRADDKLEAWARDEFETPAADPSTARDLPGANVDDDDEDDRRQDGQRAGLPRQRPPTTRTGQGAQGDRSGG